MYFDLIPFVVAALGLMFIWLSIGVIRLRRKESIAIGDAGSENLKRAIRAQANFVEYSSIFLILLFFSESYELPSWLLASSAALFLLGRILHAYSITVFELKTKSYKMRQAAILTSFACIGLLSIFLIYSSFQAF